MNLPREIRTDRLLLRRWRPEDRAPFAELNRDPRVVEFLRAPLSSEQSDALVDRIEAHFERHGYGLWAVEVPGTAPFVGFVGLVVARFEAHFTPCVEIGWRLSAGHWSRGYATEAARAALQFGFTSLRLEEIVSYTSPENVRSRRVMERIGMTRSPRDDFDHPELPEGHPRRRHVLYRISPLGPAFHTTEDTPVPHGGMREEGDVPGRPGNRPASSSSERSAEDGMHVRRVGPDDDAEWIRMRDALWPGRSPATHATHVAEFRADRTTQAVFVVDRGDGRLGGFLETGTRKYAEGCETTPVGYIEGWYVDPDVRRAGWGARLVEAAEGWARSCGYAEIASDCLLENDISLKAHTGLGYAETVRLIHFRKPLRDAGRPGLS